MNYDRLKKAFEKKEEIEKLEKKIQFEEREVMSLLSLNEKKIKQVTTTFHYNQFEYHTFQCDDKCVIKYLVMARKRHLKELKDKLTQMKKKFPKII